MQQVSYISSGILFDTADGAGSFVVTYSADKVILSNYLAGGGTTYETFVASQFTLAEQADPLISGPDADPDHDGRSNLLEYALGGLPKTPDTTGQPANARNGANVEFTYTRDITKADLVYHCESSADLANWSPQTSNNIGTLGPIETMRAIVPNSLGRKFLRLRVERP